MPLMMAPDAGPKSSWEDRANQKKGIKMNSVIKAIDQSILRNEIVTIDAIAGREGTQEMMDELEAESDDSSMVKEAEEGFICHEYWGETERGHSWRVRVLKDLA